MEIEHATGVEEFRAALVRRHQADGVLDADASARAELIFHLTRLHLRLSGDFDALHRRRGWTWAGFRIMNVLWAVGPAELRDLARLSGTSRAAISSALNVLERDGLVSRSPVDGDKRLVRVSLTARGNEELLDGMRAQAEREREWFAALEPSERAQLTASLARLADQPAPPRPAPPA
jgi:DNA-binding MarR family transcriptional regulator